MQLIFQLILILVVNFTTIKFYQFLNNFVLVTSPTNNTGGNQTAPNVLLFTNDTYLTMPETEGPRLPSASWPTETNVPLLPRGVIKRQDSLPSYDDAIKMPSAPPKE